MQITEKQMLRKRRITELSMNIQTTINDFCEKENFEVTYNEIYAALIDIMSRSNYNEMKLND